MTVFLPFVSIAVPVLNEENYIERALSSLLDQVGNNEAEILVLDGGSCDRTRDIVSRIATAHPIVRLVSNPGRTQSAACNLAATLADPRSRILIRADAHANYPRGFLSHAIQSLLDTNATSVVVPMHTVGIKPLQRAIAATQNSRLGNGGSGHRRVGMSRFVDHGHHAAFDLPFFRSLGGYDPDFTHNEDGEFDVRGLKAGGRIWLCAEAVIDYFPRSTFQQLGRQYFRHGRGRARTTVKHKLPLKLRQCLPLIILTSIMLCLLTPILPWLGLPATFYLIACLSWGIPTAVEHRDPARLLMGPAAIVMHLSWAVGFIIGYLRHHIHKPFLNPLALEENHSVGAN